MGQVELKNPRFYLNRELSMLRFTGRVLAQAKDSKIPLLERLKFLCIVSSNLDEFFEIRVAGLKDKVSLGNEQASVDGSTPMQTLDKISVLAHELVDEVYRVLNKKIMPALAKEHIRFIKAEDWSAKIKAWAHQYFNDEIMPVLSPVGLDYPHPFPRLVNKSLNFIVTLSGEDVFARNSGLAIVQAPRSLPRAIKLPKDLMPDGDNFVFLSWIIQAHAKSLFPGLKVTGCYQFRLTRNSDLYLEEELSGDLEKLLRSKLLSRNFGNVARLEIDSHCPKEISDMLLSKHQLTEKDLYYCDGPVNLGRYIAILALLQRDDLRYPAFNPALPHYLQARENIFERLKEGDVLLHHPYQSYGAVLNFIKQAALDPNVLAIKQTLYRTIPESDTVKALADAARAGKEVTVVIELRARFDEEYNLSLANYLQNAGALVIYGVIGFKTHAKLSLIVRREGNKLQRYAHLSTGNYHEDTSKIYTDFGFMTFNKAITGDVQSVFQLLTGMGQPVKLKKLFNSPFTLCKHLMKLIRFEKQAAEQGKPARIIIKVNGLSDPKIIRALYEASQAGVKIDLIVRGICCLRPGVPGVSENIRVRSIVGQFLEHSRVYYFYHGGKEKVYAASADWMERNLYYRVEVCFPINDPKLAKRLKKEALSYYLADNADAWQLQGEGSYKRIRARGEKVFSAQQRLLNDYSR